MRFFRKGSMFCRSIPLNLPSLIGWEIRALRIPMFDEVAIFVSSVSLSCTYHESAVITNCKVVTSSAAEKGTKRVQTGPNITPKSKAGNTENFDTVE